ncbi:MAG TPA: SRPBCC family protein [Solirubrobacteraceae bacterium]|nr:SRPBCC family protein [Solirubrobacteraceae bacterium]
MPSVSRSRIVAAAPERVWRVVADPHDQPRWWPLVERMEGVDEAQFTQVMRTRKGRLVRADFRVLASEPPGTGADQPGRRVWEQEVAGTPFERVLGEAVTEVLVAPSGEGTRVTITQRQQLRGYSRTGGFLLRRATRTKLSEALDALAGLF